MQTMGRRRTSNFNLPPRMHLKDGIYYHVASTKPRRWTKLHTDLTKARILWAQIENGTGGSGNTFNSALDDYLVSAKFCALADKTRRQYEHVAGELRAFFEKATLNIITPVHVAMWMDNHRSQIQANTGKAIISNIFETAVRHGLVSSNPAKFIKYHLIRGRDRLISDAEYRAIWALAESHVQIAMDIGYLTGSRIQDILDIKLQDLTQDGLYIKQGKTGKRILFLRSVALDEIVARAKALPRPIRGMALICTPRGQHYRYGTFNVHWLNAVRAAGIDGVHFHDIRAKAATDAKALGLDYQALLGHATKAMSDRYVKQREIDRVAVLPSGVKTA